MPPLPTLHHLSLFALLAEFNQLNAAAKAAQLTESEFKKVITELEADLATHLVEWLDDRVLFTAVGDEVILRARKLLTDASDLVTACQATSDPFGSRLRIGVIPTVGPFILPPLLQQMRHQHPGVRLQIREEIYPVLLDGLQQGRFDLIIASQTIAQDDMTTSLDSDVLFMDEFLLACHANHTLAQKDLVTINDIHAHELVLLEEGHCLRTQVIAACQIDPTSNEFALQVSNVNTLVHSVADGLGITLLPTIASNSRLLQGGDVTTRPFAGDGLSRAVTITWRKNHVRTQDFKNFGAFITELFINSLH